MVDHRPWIESAELRRFVRVLAKELDHQGLVLGIRRQEVRHQRMHLGAAILRWSSQRGIGLREALDVLALDEALNKLTAIDPRKGKVVELRFFGGLSVDESAEALQISAVTVMREWSMAKAWLYNTLNNEA